MKFIKWKTFFISCVVCLLPILFGIVLWKDLPDSIAVHFNFFNEADRFASKPFAVFVLPFLMMAIQMICCVICDVNSYQHGERLKFEKMVKWIIPFLTILLQTLTFGIALGRNVDIRKIVALIIGFLFLILGNYLPKFDYVKHYNLDTHKARKINRFVGFETVIMGILILISVFLPPFTTVLWLVLLIPYTAIGILYSLKVIRKD